MKKKSIEYNGKSYESIRTLCREFGINSGTLYSRLKSGLSLEDALNGFVRKIWYNGKCYPAVTLIATEYGVSYNSIFAYLQRGKTLDEAMAATLAGKKRREMNQIEVVYKDKTYTDVNKLSRDTGLSVPRIKNAIKHDIPIEEILSNVNASAVKPIFYEGKMYRSMTQLWAEKKISSTNFYRCLNKGLTVEEAIDSLLKKKKTA